MPFSLYLSHLFYFLESYPQLYSYKYLTRVETFAKIGDVRLLRHQALKNKQGLGETLQDL